MTRAPGHHPRSAPRGTERRRGAPAVAAGRVRGPGAGEGLAPDRHRRRQAPAARRSTTPSSSARPDWARPRSPCSWRGRWASSSAPPPGPVLEKPGDLVGLLTSLGPGDMLFIDEIHRLQAGAGGVPLSRDGGLPGGRAHRRGPQRADHPDGARAVHADRRHHPLRPAHAADAGPLRPGRAAGLLSGRRAASGSSTGSAAILQVPIDDGGRRARSRAGAAARRGWPTGCCAGCATTPR